MIGNFGYLARSVAALLAALAASVAFAQLAPSQNSAVRVCNTPQTMFCDAVMHPPANWRGPVFHLSQDYPSSVGSEPQPWRRFDPVTQPGEYLQAALGYFYEGHLAQNYESSFNPSQNRVRTWYHAPWQDFGVNGREFVHGLTRERTSEPGELHPSQKQRWHNYAVGLYNAPGGYTIGRVWANRGSPDPRKGIFPEGTVSAKLLFTTAPISEVPYLRGAPEWTAYVYAKPNAPKPYPQLGDARVLMKLRLLQIDIAVKDSRVQSTGGWMFGTFVYGGGETMRPGQGWGNVHAVGSMWGNDPGYSGSGPLTETWINPTVKLPHLGWQGRLNGPVDNKISSCLSCHSTAQHPQAPAVPTSGANPQPWFRNLKPGEAFAPGGISLDYSLALALGIANLNSAQLLSRPANRPNAGNIYTKMRVADPATPRDGSPSH